MANVLSIVWYKVLPARFGGQKGIAGFSHYLGLHHSVFMLCSGNNEPTGVESFKVLNKLPSSKWQFTDPKVASLMSLAADENKISHLLLEHCYHGWHGVRLAKKKKLKLIAHSHNIEYARFREMGKWWWPFLFLLERWTHQSAHLSLFKTREDLGYAIQHFGLEEERCMVVPFGLERTGIPAPAEKMKCRLALEEKHAITAGTKIILFNGTLDYEPNAQALEQIVKQIIPALERITEQPFRVLVTGRIEYPDYNYLKDLNHPCYTYAGSVDDVDTYFTGADLFINPLTKGGGVKVKLVEALSFGLPVVSYDTGAKGIDTTVTGETLSLVNDGDVETFAAAMVAQWNQHGIVSQSFFNKYSWRSITAEVATRIDQL
ncbi:MAG TPA: glycosyltransferase [Chitinophagaceae bacterium]|nr:glycosyltransferase [Chitinophagaceae bacterium]